VSITDRGADLAAKLPYEHRRGRLVETIREEWGRSDGLIVFAATAIAVRAIASLLTDKHRDPAVVCVDESGGYAVVLCGGHRRDANSLAREVAACTGATAVISTATDLAGLPAVDSLPGFAARGAIAALGRRWLDGEAPTLEVDTNLESWPIPAILSGLAPSPETSATVATKLTVTDSARPALDGEVILAPRCLVLGVGASTGASAEGLHACVVGALSSANLSLSCVGVVATLDSKVAEPAIAALAQRLGVELIGLSAAALADTKVPNPSEVVLKAVGTPSVSEAAALLSGGPGATMLVAKTVSSTGDSTVALVRRKAPAGLLFVVGLGPGDPCMRTLQATAAVRHAEVVMGYSAYVDAARDLLCASQLVVSYPIGAEAERVRDALARASEGRTVALVCSGDPGVYALASLAFELAAQAGNPQIRVIPGVTAALSAASLLGAPLGHDHASVSLSALLTPWEHIERRVKAVAEGDFVVSLYNPRSARRATQLPAAIEILLRHRAPSTPAAVVTDAGRPTQQVTRTVLGDLDPLTVGMYSLVVIGSTSTVWIGDRMVTPRGYQR
jgi:cobalt-precorrin 5A hydrolase/precorrin-3B C17-methyltransferase